VIADTRFNDIYLIRFVTTLTHAFLAVMTLQVILSLNEPHDATYISSTKTSKAKYGPIANWAAEVR